MDSKEFFLNQELLKTKLLVLEGFKNKFNKADFNFSRSCNYHGIQITFKSNSPRLNISLEKLLPENWLIDQPGKFTVYLRDPSFYNYTHEFWSSESSQDCISLKNNQVAIQRDFAAMVHDNEVFLVCEDQVGDGFYNFLRWFLSEKLMEENKYVVHASCVLGNDHFAHLFLGHSGAGKTTITELSFPRMVLGDDMNLISIQDGGLMVEAGAIGGKFNSMIGYDKKVPIKSCYWLIQSPQNNIRKMNSIMAYQKLLASFANLNWPTLSSEKAETLMTFSSRAVESQTHFYELDFVNTKEIWEILDP